MRRTVESKERAATRDVVALNYWLSITRLRAAAAVALFAGVMWAAGLGAVRWSSIVVTCLALALFSLVALRQRLGRRQPWPFFYAQMLVDILGITVGIATSVETRPEVLFSAMYFLVIVPSALISVRAGLSAAGLAAACHLFILSRDTPLAEVALSLDGALPVFLFFMVAQQSFFYSGQLERKNRALGKLAARLESSRGRLQDLIRIARTLNSTLDAPELLARSNQAALEQLGGTTAATFLVDSQRQTFRLAAVSEGRLEGNPFARIDYPIAAFPAVSRLLHEKVVTLTPAEMGRVPPALSGYQQLSAVHVAGLHREGVLVGFLGIGYVGRELPAESDVAEQLAAIAEHSTIALANAKLLEEAREASALKSEFLSTVSHELRTPLNVIIGYTEMLRDGAAGALTTRQDALFERIESSSRELFELIDAVLQVGRLETGAASAVLAPVSLAALLKTVEGSLGGLPRPDEVEFAIEVPEDLAGTLITDAPKVGLVIRNLVGNAFKFTPSGRVALRVTAEGERLTLAVSDTGVGIAPEHIPHIFEMFRQLKGSESHGGVGLGLHIVKQVVARLGGELEVESAVGSGTTFRVVLPRWQAEEARDVSSAA